MMGLQALSEHGLDGGLYARGEFRIVRQRLVRPSDEELQERVQPADLANMNDVCRESHEQ